MRTTVSVQVGYRWKGEYVGSGKVWKVVLGRLLLPGGHAGACLPPAYVVTRPRPTEPHRRSAWEGGGGAGNAQAVERRQGPSRCQAGGVGRAQNNNRQPIYSNRPARHHLNGARRLVLPAVRTGGHVHPRTAQNRRPAWWEQRRMVMENCPDAAPGVQAWPRKQVLWYVCNG